MGTLFALCEESGIAPAIRLKLLDAARRGAVSVLTDPRASPTGYPFKLVSVPNGPDPFATRERICDLGYLRVAAVGDDGRLVYRCAAEPVADYVRKGGRAEDTEGRRCLCNGLTATVGLAQVRANSIEPSIVTSGDDLAALGDVIAGWDDLRAERVVSYVLVGSD